MNLGFISHLSTLSKLEHGRSQLTTMNDPKAMAKYISCLSILEENIALVYGSLSDRVEMPLIKTLFLSISQDSSKHSILLKGVASSISDTKDKVDDCKKNLGAIWGTVNYFLSKAEKKKGKDKLSFMDLLPKLNALESSIGEEYYIFVQMRTLKLLSKEINQLYNINLESIKKVFESIIKDEEHHREILADIRDIIVDNTAKSDNTPIVIFQNPDSWINYSPKAIHDSE